jgi:predicted dehydrogenase
VIIRQGHKSTSGRTQLNWEIDGEDGVVKIEDNRSLGMNMGAHDPEHLYLNGEEVVWDEEKEGHAKYESPVPFLRDNWLAFYKGKENGANYMDIEEAAKLRGFLAAIAKSIEEGGRWIDL